MSRVKVSTDAKLVPQRIKEAREYCRLSVVELADRLDKTRQAVSQFENGTTNPTPEILAKIAEVTGFPIQYFSKAKRAQNTSTSQIPLYRGSPTKTKSLKRAYEIPAEWSDDIITYLKQYVILQDANIPSNLEFDFTNKVDIEQKVEEISDTMRCFWNLGKGPLRDIIGILENNGFILSKIPNKAKEVEAFSLWYEKVPHIFYEGNRSTAVSYNFSICHELGHLILHQALTETDALDCNLHKDLEWQANAFAGAFLLPAESFGNEYLTSNLDSFIAIKKKWCVSLGAMIMRAYALGIIDSQQKSYLFRQLSARGFRKHEPFDDEIEFIGPSIIYNSIKLLVDNKIVNFQDFIDEMALPMDDLVSICSLPMEFVNQHLEAARSVPLLRLVE